MSLAYPIKFEPILKEKIWGGEKLVKYLGKDSNLKNIGESWEISNVEGSVSIVENGTLKGQTLQELIDIYTSELLGKKNFERFGNQFPLLIKYIDAKTPLSIQLHPNDKMAKKRHNSFGKTEMWYVMQADEGSNLIAGFKKDSNAAEYVSHLENKSLLEILNVEEVSNGDVFFIPSGRIHTIGAGIMLAEIQQTSDITYRVYDWDRVDDQGNRRELHIEEALDALDYSSKETYKTNYSKIENTSNTIVDCPYFTTNILPVSEKIKVDNSGKDSFTIYMCVKGNTIISVGDKAVKLSYGETVLIPAIVNQYEILSEEISELLEVTIK